MNEVDSKTQNDDKTIDFDFEIDDFKENIQKSVSVETNKQKLYAKAALATIAFAFIVFAINYYIVNKNSESQQSTINDIKQTVATSYVDKPVNRRQQAEIDQYNLNVLNERRDEGSLEQDINYDKSKVVHSASDAVSLDQLASMQNSESTLKSGNSKANDSICEDDDTVCMIHAGLINVGDCAPKDIKCINQKKLDEMLSKNSIRQSNDINDFSSDYQSNNEIYSSRIKTQEELAAEEAERQREALMAKYRANIADEEFMQKMAVLLDKRNDQNGQIEIIEFKLDELKNESAGDTVQEINEQTYLADSVDKSNTILIKDGSVYFGINIFSINSNIPSIVKVEIANENPFFEDAYLMGSSEVIDEYLKLNLNRLILKDGRTCTVNAQGLDLETTYLALQSSIDRHIFYRYGFWTAGLLAGSIGAGMAALSDNTVIITDRGAYESIRSSTDRAIGVGLGQLGSTLSSEFQKRLDRAPTIKVDPFEQMGIIFDGQVLESQCK